MAKHKDSWRYDWTRRQLLPSIAQARELGLSRIDDVLSIVNSNGITSSSWRPYTRSAFYRAWVRLRELGLDLGPHDLAAARRHGRPTKTTKNAI